ncbi:hypothetical protein [Streptomyces sp. A 4/2]|uniref:hypothetical protein n=1 Tax=Streptomyces sp. A 4/2 TaxID=2934314 RepID=UPI0020252D71|nr:hypothetical protein [Streptomyces sp. A 4/2]
MGTNSKSSHSSYAIAPAGAPETAEGSEELGLAAAPAEPELSDGLVKATTDLMVAMDNLDALAVGNGVATGNYPELPDDPVERYDIFADQIMAAREAIEKLKEEGASEEEVKAQLDALRAQSLAYLTALDPEELQQIAAAKGFEHPALVGLSGKGQHPLVHWLDPYYNDDIPSKQKIQAAAQTRYAQLAAGQTVGGMTLADLQQIEGTSGAPDAPAGTWAATPDQFNAAVDAWNQASHEAAYAKGVLDSDKLKNLLDAEKQVLTAHSPDTPGLETKKNEIQVWTGDPLAVAKINQSTVMPLVQEALASGDMSLTEAQHLKPVELVGLLRTGTPEAEKEALKATAQARKDQLKALDNALDVHQGGKQDIHTELTLPDLAGSPEAAAQVASWAKSSGELHTLQQEAQGWIHETLQSPVDIGFANPALLNTHQVDPKALTTEFNAWAKNQKVGDLRAVAGELGMPDPGKANRAQLQGYIAASFNPALDKDAINAKVQATVAKKQAAAAAKAASPLASDEAVNALKSKLASSTGTASSPPAVAAGAAGSGGLTQESKVEAAIKMGASPVQAQKLAQAAAAGPAKPIPKAPKKPAAPGSFNGKVQALIAGLQQVKATAQDVPARIDSDVVGSWAFGAGTPANLGGTYSKSLHAAPDGSSWLFKADHNGGVIAHSEAAASHALSLGGVPAVPVYVKEVGGKVGSVQPMLKGASHFASDPHKWSQSDVDSIVRSHVGSWIVGDHDGHPANVLRTASGGLVQIDRGQAFKHWGSDKLSLGYAPSGGGSYDPVHQKLYSAALGGGLADGVKVNHAVVQPVIKNFEAIPDSQWRSMLHSTAYEGAKAGSGVHWVPAMRKQAAKKHGIAAAKVSTEQIAEAFLDHAVERKQNLRKAFAEFFVKDLKMPQAASLKHGAE